jgi:hypothetical protein
MPHSAQDILKNFDRPDERRDFKDHGYLEVVNFPDGTVFGRAIFEPGWRWSNDVKPIAGTESCEASHNGYVVSGSMTIRMNDGTEFTVKAGDVFHLPPGHDAWVNGNERCVMLDFGGYKDYAKPASEPQAA